MIKYLYIILISIFLNLSFLNGQTISPYLETNESQAIQLLENDSVINNYTFHYLLGVSNQEFYYTYYGDESIDLNFIVPNRINENIYHLTAEYNNQQFELKANSIKNIQKHIHQYKLDSQFEHRIFIENSILSLPNVSKGTKIKVTLKKALTLNINQIKYNYLIPEIISIRPKEFSYTKKITSNKKPQKVVNSFSFFGNSIIEELTINKNQLKNINSTNYKNIDTINEQKHISYYYQANQISSGVTSATINNCNYYFGTIQPPINRINTPKEIIFIIDGSGSMKGKPIELIKSSIERILNQLNEKDKFNILIYAADNLQFSSISLQVTKENIIKANLFVSREFGNGNLKLNQAINHIDHLKLDPNYNRIIAILSDGDLDFDQNIHVAIQQQLKNAHLFLLGIGNEINYKTFHYFELVTGNKPIVINDLNQAQSKLASFEYKIIHPMLKNIRLYGKNVQLNETFPYNFNGYLSDENLHFISKDCLPKKDKQLIIKGHNGKSIHEQNLIIHHKNELEEALKFYWAKEKITNLLKKENRCGDDCKKNKVYQNQIEQIANAFNLSSPYTFLTQKESMFFSNDFDLDQDLTPDWFDECPYQFGAKISKGCAIDGLKNQSKDYYIQDSSNEILRIVEFDLDKDILRPVDYKKLDEIVSLLNQNTKLDFYLIGHTDSRGSKKYNQDLSIRRAKAVYEYLTHHGISPQRLTIIGKGDTQLKHKECTPAERCEEWKNLENRRVELKIKKD